MELICDTCGAEFTARAGAKYCSGRCRTLAYRRRSGESTEPRRRRPLPEAFWETAYDLERKADRLERLAEDDRFQRNAASLAHHRNQLLMISETIQRVAEQIPEPEPFHYP